MENSKEEELLSLIATYHAEFNPEGIDEELVAEVARAFIVDSKKQTYLSKLIQDSVEPEQQ